MADHPILDAGAGRLYYGYAVIAALPLAGVVVTIPGIIYGFKACSWWDESAGVTKAYPVSGRILVRV